MARVDQGYGSSDEPQYLSPSKNEPVSHNGFGASQRTSASDNYNLDTREKPIQLRTSSTSRGLMDSSEKLRSVTHGMGMSDVRNLWGLPDQVQVAGSNARSGNTHERWIYHPTLYEPITRVVYFEGGRVSGWERQ